MGAKSLFAIWARRPRVRVAHQQKRTALCLEKLEARCLLALGPLVNISGTPSNESECTIAINPTNSNNMFAASNGIHAGNVDQDFEYYSFDGGRTWSRTVFSPAPFPQPNDGDQQAAFDNYGNLHMVYLTIDPVTRDAFPVWAVSTDGGRTFSIAQRFADHGDQPSVAVGPGGIFSEVQVAITYYDTDLNSINVRAAAVFGLGNIDGFQEFVLPGTDNANFGSVAVGPDGTVLINYEQPADSAGPATIYANHSSALLQTGFGVPVAVANTQVGGFFPTPANSHNTIDAEANLAWDLSGQVIGNPVYMIYTDVGAGGGANTDILVSTSTDDGQTWSTPTRISDNVASTKILPAVAVDPTSGSVAVAWYDTRNGGGLGGVSNVDVYATVGIPGSTWQPNQRLSTGPSSAFLANDPKDFGDYEGMAAYGGSFYYCWADNSGAFPTNAAFFDVVTRKATFNGFGAGLAPAALKPSGGNLPASGISLFAVGIPVAGGMPLQDGGREPRRSAVADDLLALFGVRRPDGRTAIPLALRSLAGDPSGFLGRSHLEPELELVDRLLASDALSPVDFQRL